MLTACARGLGLKLATCCLGLMELANPSKAKGLIVVELGVTW